MRLKTYVFNVPNTPPKSQASIGPGENRLMTALLPYSVSPSEINEIKEGVKKALWVWGEVHYEDAFGSPHFTQFCQKLFWLKDGRLFGVYDGRFGKSN